MLLLSTSSQLQYNYLGFLILFGEISRDFCLSEPLRSVGEMPLYPFFSLDEKKQKSSLKYRSTLQFYAAADFKRASAFPLLGGASGWFLRNDFCVSIVPETSSGWPKLIAIC